MDTETTVRQAMKESGLTQVQLAQKIGATQPIISRTLKSPIINTQSHWPAILDALGLEIVVQKKEK